MKSKTIVYLWMLAGIVPLVCVVAGGWLYWRVTDRPAVFMVEPGIAVMLALLAASPFVVLALMAAGRLRTEAAGVAKALVIAATTGCVVTAGVWGLFYYDAYVYWKQGLRTGANIGSGLLLLVSPLIVGVAMTAAYRLAKYVVAGRGRSVGTN